MIVVGYGDDDAGSIRVRPCVGGRRCQVVTCHCRGVGSSAAERYKLQRPDLGGLGAAPAGGGASVATDFVASEAAAKGQDRHQKNQDAVSEPHRSSANIAADPRHPLLFHAVWSAARLLRHV